MFLQKLNLVNYRNHAVADLEFNSRINVLIGDNGSGKTNLLDAVYYLSFTKSSLQSTDQLHIRKGEEYFVVRGTFVTPAGTRQVAASCQVRAKKMFREDDRDVSKLSEHIGKYPVVMMAPDDVDLIREGGESRRRFFDSLISQVDSAYLEHLIRYHQVLKQRNGLLKLFQQRGQPDWSALEVYDNLLAASGQPIYEKRSGFLKLFLPIFVSYYKLLVEEREQVDIRYTSDLEEMDMLLGCQLNRQKDLVLQRTNVGIHRDDFPFLLDGNDIKRFGSQGQQKSFAIALRLAQWEVIREAKQFKPVILMDDIFDKLDDFRISRLLELIKDELGQIFITDARPDRTRGLLAQIAVEASAFRIHQGQITAVP